MPYRGFSLLEALLVIGVFSTMLLSGFLIVPTVREQSQRVSVQTDIISEGTFLIGVLSDRIRNAAIVQVPDSNTLVITSDNITTEYSCVYGVLYQDSDTVLQRLSSNVVVCQDFLVIKDSSLITVSIEIGHIGATSGRLEYRDRIKFQTSVRSIYEN